MAEAAVQAAFAVARPLASGLVGGSRESTAFRQACCQEVPDWETVVSLNCTCDRNAAQINLRENDIPSTVERITISGAQSILIHASAIFALSQLMSFTIEDCGQVQVLVDGFALPEEARLQSLKLRRIEEVTMDGLSLSRHWKSTTLIQMQDISKLTLRTYSFGHQSTSLGPAVEISGIGDFQENGAFAGPISSLTLSGVKEPLLSCSRTTFGRHIHSLKLDGITIREVGERCFHGDGVLASLSIHSCEIHEVRSWALFGDISTVDIKNSDIGQIAENGFNISASRMSITDSRIERMSRDGLRVRAREAISLQRVWVSRLGPGALTGLRGTGAAPVALSITGLHVAKADFGSLAFDTSVSVCLSALELGEHRPRPCPVDPLVRQLTDADAGRPLSHAQLLVLRQLQQPDSCPGEQPAPPSSCDAAAAAGAGAPAVVAALILLSLALVAALSALLVLHGRRLWAGCALWTRSHAGRSRASPRPSPITEDGYSLVQKPTPSARAKANGQVCARSPVDVKPAPLSNGGDYAEVFLPPSTPDQAPPLPPVTLERLESAERGARGAGPQQTGREGDYAEIGCAPGA